jgi:hypothetical protein
VTQHVYHNAINRITDSVLKRRLSFQFVARCNVDLDLKLGQSDRPLACLSQCGKGTARTAAGFEDLGERQHQNHQSRRIPDFETLPTWVAYFGKCLDPHLGRRLKCFQIGGVEIGQFQTIIVAVGAVLVAVVKKESGNGSLPLFGNFMSARELSGVQSRSMD